MTVSELRRLVDNLDEYIHIRGGIDRLKKMVLHLAVSGQLVPQDPLEGTGEDLYREIQDEKEVLVRQGRIKKQKTLPEINSDATPFVIPESWKWARLANVTIFSIGRTPSRSESKYWNSDYMPWVSIADLRANSHIGTTKEKISKEAYEKCFGGIAVPAGSLLYSFKLTIGKMSIIDMDAVHNEAIASFATINPIFTEYLFKALGVIDPTARTNSAVMGKTLNSATLSLLEIPLPPLGEQKRIVAKVDSIFALIDQLAEVYKSEQAERSKLVASSLAQLAKGEDGVQGSLALTHLSEIIHTKADAKILRQTILHLAVSGQLVPQDPSEGTGEELYQQIQAEKAELIKQGKIKVQKHQQSIGEDEILFKIPDSWKWVRLIEVSDRLSAGGDKPKDFSKLESDTNTIPVIANGETNKGVIGYTSEARVCVPSVTVSGRGTIGYSEVRDCPYTPIVRLIVVEPCSRLDLKYLKFVFTSILEVGQGTSIPQLTVPMVSPKPIPLPPFAEQRRIVAKTTQLLNLITELEERLVG
ncbi:MAG: hypothetical protein EOO17_02365 [Chloroflexi bacterium]|nr:MAG: hypothetical protein EOO17_02365 [Chloroflexota bacterium]